MLRAAYLLFFAFALPLLLEAKSGNSAIVYGGGDKNHHGWAVMVTAPGGWTSDCCNIANEIGANLVMFQPPWTGSPDRVMLMTAWPNERPSLDDDWKADHERYAKDFVRQERFNIAPKNARCRSAKYVGHDNYFDYVVFCEPNHVDGFRFAWSMKIKSNDPAGSKTAKAFATVVSNSVYMNYMVH